MKKIIILTIATLSTGIVLSRSLKKDDVVVKPTISEVQKSTINQKNAKTSSYNDAIAVGD